MSASTKAPRIDVSTYPDHALIREADGLTQDEKLLLHTIASHEHGKSFGSVATLRDWTGLSRNKYYQARGGLLAKGLISAHRSPGGVTTYRFRRTAVEPLARKGILRRKVMPAVGTTPAQSGQGTPTRSGHGTRDRGGDTKENSKSNTEEIKNMKKPRRARPITSRKTQRHALDSGGDWAEQQAEKRRQIQAKLDRLQGRSLGSPEESRERL